MKNTFVSILFLLITTLLSAQYICWKEEFPRVWKGSFGNSEAYNLLSASQPIPNGEAINRLEQFPFPFNIADIYAEKLFSNL